MEEARQPLTPPHEEEEFEDDGRPDYTGHHLAAVMKPVALTMACAVWVVLHIRESGQDSQLSSGMSVYLVSNENGAGKSSSEKFGSSIINSLVIIAVITVATFILVLCYKYRCMKLMVGYLIFASANLLGYTGGFVVYTALKVYSIILDWPTLFFLMYNFAAAGVVAVFWQKGIPRIVTQGYLVCVSVIMAWIVTKLPVWTGWTLLVALALYDLCAVLTPCGPLKQLVNLAQKHKDPIPGLLYEADVGGRDSNPGVVRDVIARPPPSRPTTSNASSGTSGNRVIEVQPAANASSRPREDPEAPPRTVTPDELPTAPAAPGVSGALKKSGGSADEDELEQGRRASATRAHEQHYEPEEEEEEEQDRSIKLGLGDFVFYSVLVSRSALFDLSSMAASFIAIIMGLGGTLMLLAVFKKALPALPISIFAGVVVYLLTRTLVVPFIVELSLNGVFI